MWSSHVALGSRIARQKIPRRCLAQGVPLPSTVGLLNISANSTHASAPPPAELRDLSNERTIRVWKKANAAPPTPRQRDPPNTQRTAAAPGEEDTALPLLYLQTHQLEEDRHSPGGTAQCFSLLLLRPSDARCVVWLGKRFFPGSGRIGATRWFSCLPVTRL